MRRLGWLLLAAVLAGAPVPMLSQQDQAAGTTPSASGSPATAPPPGPLTRPVGTVSELMVQIVYPTSDAVFYIETRTPETDAAWAELQTKMLSLAESANLLMMPGRARDQDRWMKDARMMLDAGTAAYRAAKQKDASAIAAVSETLLTSCITCHQDYRPTYRRRLP
jgi:hypothetical protein